MAECSIEGCGKKSFCRGWCTKHYTRWQRYGDPTVITRTPPLDAGATERFCPRCLTIKPLSDFGVRPTGAPKGYCSDCQSQYDKAYAASADGQVKRRAAQRRHDISDQRRDRELRKRYGITFVEYVEILDRQGGRCAVCGGTEATPGDARRRWNVDHCHTTGKVRGLLCINCNMGLGYFMDDPKRLRAAITYLEAAASG